MKNMLNALTDLQRIQHILLGTKVAYTTIRSGLRMQTFLGVFKRMSAIAVRRCERIENEPAPSLSCAEHHSCTHCGAGLATHNKFTWEEDDVRLRLCDF